MADTAQIVMWALERACPLRSGDGWFLPDRTATQLALLRSVASAEKDRRIVNGICVTSWTTAWDTSGKGYDIPHSGFPIEQRLEPIGGLKEAAATCGTCEANAGAKTQLAVAGCFGSLDFDPDSKELDRRLREIIAVRGLDDRFRAAFQATSPLWYGFWMQSPLRRAQCELLHELLGAACDPEDSDDEDIRAFVRALDAAVRWELPIHVSLAPLGHTDFGWYTVFPHCPRCKANAPVGRWQGGFTKDPHECRACGHTFVPDEHHSSEKYDFGREDDELKRQLGPAAYEEFVRAFLVHRGCTEQKAAEVIDNKNNGPLLRRTLSVRKQREATLRRLRETAACEPSELNPPTLLVPLAVGVDLEFVLIPAGEFLMGAPGSEKDSTEGPQHLVRIPRPLYIGRFPVTQAQWTAMMGTDLRKQRMDSSLPIDQASWFDAQEFCECLCLQHRRVFRLPSEAEWEYACRAGTRTSYAFGDTLSPNQANFTPYATQFGAPAASEEDLIRKMEQAVEFNVPASRSGKTTTVGSFPPNAWGLYDMHGNVDEWCEDVWHPTYESAPTDGSAWLEGEESEPFRVMRGGRASATEFVCTSSSRRQMRTDAGSHAEDEDKEQEEDELEEGDEFTTMLFEMMFIPYGFRLVCECR